ncbi:MAG TPA: thymidine kinase [Patescibacteria group bacterium]|nr:thymidine kinase [Patescibacteria group bacterium]
MKNVSKRIGYLEVIAGPMYCGKTEELIRQVKRAAIAKKHVQVFKHAIDTRYGNDRKVFSHAGLSFESELVTKASQILKNTRKNTDLIAIDEAQWFGGELIPVIQKFLDEGKHVIVAGLAMTYDRQPFPPIPTLMSMADKSTKLSAICSICGAEAVFHKRITDGKKIDPLKADPSLVGRLDSYEARCRNCFSKKP